MRHNSLTLELLEHLLVCGTSMVLGSLFVPYGKGLGGVVRDVERHMESCPHEFSLYSRKSVSVTLSRLKEKKMVVKRGPNKKAVWSITVKGKSHFKDIGKKEELPSKDGKIRLVMYDIPEALSTQRVWIRSKLSACDYACLQKSVWMGIRPLPKKMEKQLQQRGIARFVHVVGLEGFINDLTKKRKSGKV